MGFPSVNGKLKYSLLMGVPVGRFLGWNTEMHKSMLIKINLPSHE